ncbi:hypothetical protein C3L33_15756, partial [Rhododendron williamsianum]
MSDPPEFRIGQRVHSAGDSRRIGTVKYVGPVEGYSGKWVGVDWDNADGGKHDGSLNGVRYFHAESEKSGSFQRAIADEMYVFSASNRRVSVQLLGKDKIQDKLSRFEELASASLFYLGVSSSGPPCQISATIPNLKELDLTGNLLSDWKDVGAICEGLPALVALNLTNNLMAHDILGLPQLRNIRVLVLNNTGIKWIQVSHHIVEMLKCSLPVIEELHLMGNKLSAITIGDNDNGLGAIGLNLWEDYGVLDDMVDWKESRNGRLLPPSSDIVQGFDSLRLLNLEDNCIADWNEILKLSQLKSLEQLHLNKNSINHLWYPEYDTVHDQLGCESVETSGRPFQNLRCLLLGGNNIEDLASVDSLNSFPNLKDTRLSENQIADPGKGGLPRFVLIARLAQVDMLNGSEVSRRERKDSEIRYVRLVMSKLHDHPEEITLLHPRTTTRAEENDLGAAEKMDLGEWLRAFFGRILDIGELTMPPITRSIRAVGEKMRDKVKRGLVMRGIVNSPMSKILPENAWSHSPRSIFSAAPRSFSPTPIGDALQKLLEELLLGSYNSTGYLPHDNGLIYLWACCRVSLSLHQTNGTHVGDWPTCTFKANFKDQKPVKVLAIDFNCDLALLKILELAVGPKNHVAKMLKREHGPITYCRFLELKEFHGIEDEKPSTGAAGPQKMASGLISITLKCVGASMGEKPPLTKKLPAPTTVGKLKILCESFFKLKSVKPVLFLEEEGSPLPTVLDDDMATLIDVGVGNDSTVLVDEES